MSALPRPLLLAAQLVGQAAGPRLPAPRAERANDLATLVGREAASLEGQWSA